MLCPFLKDGCKSTECRFWYEEARDCSMAVDYKDSAKWILEGQKIPSNLKIVNKTLDKVLTRNFLKGITKSEVIQDSDRLLLENLLESKERIEKDMEVDEMLEGVDGL